VAATDRHRGGLAAARAAIGGPPHRQRRHCTTARCDFGVRCGQRGARREETQQLSESRSGHADRQPLREKRREDRRPAGAERAQRRDLRPPPEHRDRDRVRDKEGAHEQRQGTQGVQVEAERPHHALGGGRGAARRFQRQARGKPAPDLPGGGLAGDPRIEHDVHAIDAIGLAQERLRRPEIRDEDVAAGGPRDARKLQNSAH